MKRRDLLIIAAATGCGLAYLIHRLRKSKQQFGNDLLDYTVTRNLAVGDEGPDVLALTTYLRRFGYLPNPALEKRFQYRSVIRETPRNPTRYDRILEAAVRVFQEFYGLKCDGQVNEETLRLIREPRCGVPDVRLPFRGARYVPVSKWKTTYNLTWSFALKNKPSYLHWKDVGDAAMAGFNAWSERARISFAPYLGDIDVSSIFRFHFGPNVHHTDFGLKCPVPFPTNVYAHAFYPPPDGQGKSDLHFNNSMAWATAAVTPPNAVDFASVALHEIGHSIGLGHTPVSEAVMYAYFSQGTQKRILTKDDIEGIQYLYGPK